MHLYGINRAFKLNEAVAFAAAVSIVFLACGKVDTRATKAEQEKEAAKVSNAATSALHGELLDFQVGIQPLEASLNLASAIQSYVADVNGCKSGFRIVGHNSAQAGAVFRLYRGDQSCTFALKSFQYNSKNWVKIDGGGLTAPASAEFVNSLNSLEKLTVKGVTGLPVTIADNAPPVLYTITEVAAGQKMQMISMGAPNLLPHPSRDAPNFRAIRVIPLQPSKSSQTETPELEMTFECNEPLITNNTVCRGAILREPHLMTNIDARLVNATSFNPATYNTAVTIMSTATTDITTTTLLPPSPGFNGGFKIKIRAPINITGGTARMILFLDQEGRTAPCNCTYHTFTYFYVDTKGIVASNP
jgi:hypothetical protein